MQIIPTLELMDGRCVSLRMGALRDPILWHVDPVETVLRWVAEGAEIVRVTDFSAMEGRTTNETIIADIIRRAGVPVQVAGGIRSRERAAFWIDRGAGQVVVGTLAAQAPQEVMTLAKYFPDWVVLALDVAGGRLRTHGWTADSALDPATMLAVFAESPLAGVIVTDIDSDAAEVDKQLGTVSGLAAGTRHRVIASGMVDSLDDLSRLRYVPGIDGALVGRALMRKTFTLAEALEIARPAYEETAAFR